MRWWHVVAAEALCRLFAGSRGATPRWLIGRSLLVILHVLTYEGPWYGHGAHAGGAGGWGGGGRRELGVEESGAGGIFLHLRVAQGAWKAGRCVYGRGGRRMKATCGVRERGADRNKANTEQHPVLRRA